MFENTYIRRVYVTSQYKLVESFVNKMVPAIVITTFLYFAFLSRLISPTRYLRNGIKIKPNQK